MRTYLEVHRPQEFLYTGSGVKMMQADRSCSKKNDLKECIILPESITIDVKRRLPRAKEEGSPEGGGAVSGLAQRELSGEERAKLLDV